MEQTAKKRKVLTVEDKFNVIKEIENGKKKADVCREFHLVNSTVQTIWKNRDKIVSAFEKNESKIKRLRKPDRSDVDEALLKWFKQKRSENVPLSGPLLMTKADELAKLLNHEDFVCTTGWLDRFKTRHNISFGKISGEAKSVDSEITTEWVKTVWPKLREGYEDCDIFNADETGIFYKLTPDKTLKFKGEKCIGGKMAKDRITVFVCSNATGSEKKKLLVIGKSKRPRPFKNIKNLPVLYSANKKAWMTSDIFESELRRWDQQLKLQNRNILLLVDNCPAHPRLDNLHNIKLVFLPPNSTSVLQPMDQGVIRSLKNHFRKLILLRMIECIDKKEAYNINLLDAVRSVNAAWKRVTEKTIRNCFRHSGITQEEGSTEIESSVVTSEDDEDDLPLSEWVRRIDNVSFASCDLDGFVSVDDNVLTTESLTAEDIVAEVKNQQIIGDSEGEEEEETEVNVPTISEALQAIRVVHNFYEATSKNVQLICDLQRIERDLQVQYFDKRKQTQMTDFFKARR